MKHTPRKIQIDGWGLWMILFSDAWKLSTELFVLEVILYADNVCLLFSVSQLVCRYSQIAAICKYFKKIIKWYWLYSLKWIYWVLVHNENLFTTSVDFFNMELYGFYKYFNQANMCVLHYLWSFLEKLAPSQKILYGSIH